MRNRTMARELSLKFLYRADLLKSEDLDELAEFLEVGDHDPEIQDYARDLVQGVTRTRQELDGRIQEVAKNWDVHRMAIIDRNILRQALYEMLHRTDIPAKVSINEAIELGKRYSTQNSGAFINGILDRIVAEIGLDTSDDAETEAEAEPETANASPATTDEPTDSEEDR